MALWSKLHDTGLLLRKATDEDCVYPASLPGELLHRQVPPDRWCVTQEDLRHFHRVVERAVREGEIQPTKRDAFDPQDRINGPNIYTVTEQFIKPVTMAAGQPSWALMRHQEGLECDIFVTHAWSEGIFEFIRKVLASWPRGARNAWCCMLANPQNLDIGHLIADPGSSPFAIALRASKYVMVVPNRHISIYSRLWCAYEAYLGYCERKVIFTAYSCMGRAACRAYVALAIVVIIIHGFAIIKYMSWEVFEWTILLQDFAALAYLIAENVADAEPRLLLILNGINFGLLQLDVSVDDFSVFDPRCDVRKTLFRYFQAGYPLIMHFYVLRRAMKQKERRRLDIQYTGTIRDAACFSEQDSDRIWAEIVGDVLQVDHTIGVLVKAGVSTEELRQLDGLGLNVRGAADPRFGSAIISWAAFLDVGLEYATLLDNFTQDMVWGLFLGCFALWLWIVAQQHIDRKTFSCRVATLILWLSICIVNVLRPWILILGGAGLACLALSWAGPLAVAYRGRCGLWFAKSLVEGLSSRRRAGSMFCICSWLTVILGAVSYGLGEYRPGWLIDERFSGLCVYGGLIMVITGVVSVGRNMFVLFVLIAVMVKVVARLAVLPPFRGSSAYSVAAIVRKRKDIAHP